MKNRFIVPKHAEFLLVALLIIGFVALELMQPKSPGMDFGDGLIWDQYLAGQIQEMLRQNSFWELLWTGRLPCERLDYHGTLMAYLYLPVLSVFGRNWMIAKHWPLFWAVPTLLFAFLFMRTVYGKLAAFLSLCFLVVHPAYVFGIREGGALLSHMQFFSMGSLCFLGYWWTTRRVIWLSLAMVFLGLGQSTQLWFVWFIFALGTSAVFFAPRLRERFSFGQRQNPLPVIGLACISLLAGASLIIYREIVYRFASLDKIVSRLSHFGTTENPAWHFLDGLVRNFKVFSSYLASRSLIEATFTFKPMESSVIFPFANWTYPWFILALALFLLSNAARSRAGNRSMFLPVILSAMIIISALSHTGGPHLHFFFLYPLPQMLAGAGIALLWSMLKNHRWPMTIGTIIILVIFVGEARTLGKYQSRFAQVRHGTLYSDLIYDVAEWLHANGLTTSSLAVFNDAEDVTRRLYFILPESDFRPLWLEMGLTSGPEAIHPTVTTLRLASKTGPVLFVRYLNEIHTGYMDKIRGSLGPLFDFRILKQFHSDDGTLAFEIYSLQPKNNTTPRKALAI